MSKNKKIKVIDTKDIKCPHCNSRNFKLQTAKDGIGLIACLDCGKHYEADGYFVDIKVNNE